MRWWDDIIDSMDMSLSKLWEILKDRGVWHAVAKSWTRLVTEQQQHMNLREHNSAYKKNTILESRLDLIIRRTSKLPISDLVNLN